MKSSTARNLRVLFYAYVAVTFLHIAYVVNREPFAFDAWNIAQDTGAKPATIGRFFAFWHQQYTTSNPRIGQPFAYLAYKIGGVAELGTPLAFFAIVLAGFVLGVGRWPDRKNGRDLAVLAAGIGLLWIAGPNLPAYVFCRAYATNYIWTIAFQLWFLVPLRLRGAGSDVRTRPLGLAGYFLLGVAAGMSNEHTGPTLVAFALGYAVWAWRWRGKSSPLVWTGVAGALVGYALIFFAPGQSQRYEGLAERYGLTQQILVRGFTGNIDIFLDFLKAIVPVLVIATIAIAIGLYTEARDAPPDNDTRAAQRRALGFVALALAAGSLIAITVFASPKLGPRFYLHAGCLMLAGGMGVFAAFLRTPRALAPIVAFAAVVSVYAGARTIPLYTRTARESDTRLAELVAAPVGGVATLEAWPQIAESWWTLGDDARDQRKQEMLAQYFGLDRVLFRGSDKWRTLGVTDVKLTMQYTIDPPMCLDQIEQLDLKPYVGADVASLHHAFLDEIAEIERFTGAKVKAVDLTATFLGTQPPLPRKRILVGRYKDGVLEGYTAGIKRAGRSADRQIVLSPELAKADFDIYVMLIGEPPRELGSTASARAGAPLVYAPWQSGSYWVLACGKGADDPCFVTFSTNHVI